MDATPNTMNYMVGGYVVFAVVTLAYIWSLVSRWNNLKREQQMLDDTENKK